MFLTGWHARPYVAVGAGMVRVTLRPAFILGGADVTSNLPVYGVTLGGDLTGQTTKFAFTGGLGVRMSQARWYLDAGLRVTRIRTVDEVTNAVRASATLGLRF
jgi:hypothetical protein